MSLILITYLALQMHCFDMIYRSQSLGIIYLLFFVFMAYVCPSCKNPFGSGRALSVHKGLCRKHQHRAKNPTVPEIHTSLNISGVIREDPQRKNSAGPAQAESVQHHETDIYPQRSDGHLVSGAQEQEIGINNCDTVSRI